MVASATGFDEKRGDIIDVQAVEFVDGLEATAAVSPGVMDWVSHHAGTLINAAAFILVVFLVTFFGLRPMTAALTRPAIAGPGGDAVPASLTDETAQARLAQASGDERVLAEGAASDDEIRMKIRPAPQERLARMADLNEERTAQILRKWAHPEAEAV